MPERYIEGNKNSVKIAEDLPYGVLQLTRDTGQVPIRTDFHAHFSLHAKRRFII